mgnify:CR=1 FL=1
MAKSGVSGYAAISARVRAMYSSMLSPQDFARLSDAPTLRVANLDGHLREFEPKELTELESEMVDRQMLDPEEPAEMFNIRRLGWFNENPLRSGWAWGQKYLEKGSAAVEVEVVLPGGQPLATVERGALRQGDGAGPARRRRGRRARTRPR